MKKELKKVLETCTETDIRELISSLNKAAILKRFKALNKCSNNDISELFKCDPSEVDKMMKGAFEYSSDQIKTMKKIESSMRVARDIEISNLLKNKKRQP